MESANVEGKEKRLVTAALPYINNVPHLGHITGSHLPADIFARYCRLKGYETIFVGGTDENGTPSEIAAQSIGIDIHKFSSKIYEVHKEIYDWFGISYDIFSRTSNEIHAKTTQEIFKKVYENGFISEKEIEMFYCEHDKRYLPDRYVKGTCPFCGYEDANGDQCEKCSKVIDTKGLVNPKCSICGSTPILRKTKHLFINLDKLSDKLEVWLNSNSFWKPHVRNLALSWVKELKPRCITRDLKNGIKVPLEGYENKVFYVWFDAPIGYLSFLKELKHSEDFWKESQIYHFLGKDNIPFHTVFFPGTLMAAGDLNLPHEVIGFNYLNYEGGKFSKSKSRGIFCDKLSKVEKYHGINSDMWRAYLTLIMPESADSDFKWNDFAERINADLIGNLGNFVNRVWSFIANKLDGEIKKPESLGDAERELVGLVSDKVANVSSYLEQKEFKKAFFEILSISSDGNKYFNDLEPWVVVKNDVNRAKNILYICACLCRSLGILVYPFLPSSGVKILSDFCGEEVSEGMWDSTSTLSFSSKIKIGKPDVLFNKIDLNNLEKVKEMVSKPTPLKEFFKD